MTLSSTLQPPMMQANSISPQRRSLWIPGLFIGLMLLVVAVNGSLIYFALHTFSGLDTDHAYQEGLDYNATLAAAAASDALGWQVDIALRPAAGGDRMTLRLADKSGRPIEGLAVKAHLVRTVSTALDRFVALSPVSGVAGTYQADVALPARGNWEIRLFAHGDGPEWQKTMHVFVQ